MLVMATLTMTKLTMTKLMTTTSTIAKLLMMPNHYAGPDCRGCTQRWTDGGHRNTWRPF